MLQLNLDNRAKIVTRQCSEAHNFVDAVHKLRFEILDWFYRQVACHDQDRVGEIHRAPLAIGETAIIKHLQQDVEHLRMSLFDFV